ncbi:MAG: carbohydrate porin [Candidatus Omnitrophica bacterium]|nr:carbohydrate porin [Candidatus Omnitrophota bacterium]
MKKFAIFVIVFFCAASVSAAQRDATVTADQHFRAELCPSSHIEPVMGDWQGTRSDLAEKGVTFESSYVADILGNASGGKKLATRYNHSMGWDVNFNLEKFAGLKGTQFHISGLWRAGRNLTTDAVGNAFVVSSIYGSQQFRLMGLYLEKLFLDKRINIRIGRLAAGDDFASSPIYWNFVTNAIDGNPVAIPINVFFPCYPNAVWGVRAKCNVTKDIYTTTGLYNGDSGVPRMAMYGLDFSLRLKKGLLFAQEVAYAPNTGPECPVSALPGHYKAGFYYHGGTFFDQFEDINGSSAAITGENFKKHIGNYGLYFHADQMLYKHKNQTCGEGLTSFVVATLAPENINKFPFFIDGGFVYKGLVPTRNHDILSVGFAYGMYSRSLGHAERDNREVNGSPDPIQSYELVFDFSYKVQITPWMFLQPDMQYVINPSGGHDVPDAFVLGTRFGLTF